MTSANASPQGWIPTVNRFRQLKKAEEKQDAMKDVPSTELLHTLEKLPWEELCRRRKRVLCNKTNKPYSTLTFHLPTV